MMVEDVPAIARVRGMIAGIVRRLVGTTSARARIDRLEASVQALQAERQMMTVALNHIGRGIQMTDGDGRIVLANDQAAEMLGLSPAFLATKPLFTEVVAAQWKQAEFSATTDELRQRFQLPLHDDHRAECYRRRRPNGRMVEVESIPLASGGMVRTHTDITDRYEAEQKIDFLARHDFLTGLANRAQFQDRLDAALAANEGVAILLIDVDRFKEINDTHGHQIGDGLLQKMAERLRTNTRDGDLVARLGGDEFAMILTPLHRIADAERIAAQLIAVAAHPFDILDRQVTTGISIGIATTPASDIPPATDATRNDLIQQTDVALYAAKAAGRGRWRSYTASLRDGRMAEQAIRRAVRIAADNGQFEVFYQPVVDLRSGEISAVEALLRWHHPDRGLLSADAFIGAVESAGLIVSVGAWVLQQACQEAARWPSDVRLLVNISAGQLGSPDMLAVVEKTLTETGLAPWRLELEITETSLLQLSDVIKTAMTRLQALGVRFALDDFGTGFSSLTYLRLFPFNTIKIDRSFVAEATRRLDCGAIVRAVVNLARDMGMVTIAEGVEEPEQVEWLQILGCMEAQGYLFSHPHPASHIPAIIAALVPPASAAPASADAAG